MNTVMKTGFGYGNVLVGTIRVFTAKVLLGIDANDFDTPMGVNKWFTNKGKIMLSFETTNYADAQRMYNGIDAIRKAIAERRYQAKYSHINAQPMLTAYAINQMMAEMERREQDQLVLVDDLPF